MPRPYSEKTSVGDENNEICQLNTSSIRSAKFRASKRRTVLVLLSLKMMPPNFASIQRLSPISLRKKRKHFLEILTDKKFSHSNRQLTSNSTTKFTNFGNSLSGNISLSLEARSVAHASNTFEFFAFFFRRSELFAFRFILAFLQG